MDRKNHKAKGAVLITGAAKRIGAGLARYFAAEGYELILHYRSSRKELKELLKDLEHLTAIKTIRADFSKSAKGVIQKAMRLNPRLVGLINNASMFEKGNLKDDRANFYENLNVNALVPLVLTQDFAARIKTKKTPLPFVINFTDANMQSHAPRFQNYRISKKIVDQFTKECARIYAPLLRVNAIAPGPIIAAVGETATQFPSQVEKTLLKTSPGIEGIVACVDFLVKTEFLTGQILYADSGMHLL